MIWQMDNETKKSLDNVVKELQKFICVEYNKFGEPDKERVKDYLIAIQLINKEFKTNYSLNPKRYHITELPSFENSDPEDYIPSFKRFKFY
jgi:hypothetical protein